MKKTVAKKVTFSRKLDRVEVKVYTDKHASEFSNDASDVLVRDTAIWVVGLVVAEGYALACVPEEVAPKEVEW